MGSYPTKVEMERESLVRSLPCETCGAEPGCDCFFGLSKNGTRVFQWSSHTGRYNAAVAGGLVPALPAVRHG